MILRGGGGWALAEEHNYTQYACYGKAGWCKDRGFREFRLGISWFILSIGFISYIFILIINDVALVGEY